MARKRTHAEYLTQVAEKHEGRIEVLGNYVNQKTKVLLRCTIDGHTWEALPMNTYNQGNGCPACQHRKHSLSLAREAESFVGQTSADGHLILKHTGYKQYAHHKRIGNKGVSKYLYECVRCGEKGESTGNALKTPGKVPGCNNCNNGRRENIHVHLHNPGKANSLCQFYIYTLDDDLLVKIGISNNIHRRGQRTYPGFPEHCRYLSPLYVSQKYKRSDIWVAEQIIHEEFKGDSADVPEEWNEYGYWSGASEVYGLLIDTDAVVLRFYELMEEIAVDGFHAVYLKYTNKTKTPFSS